MDRGLSPRVRGNPPPGPPPGTPPGSIPACTGEPAVWDAAWAAARVYPRVYGGTPPHALAAESPGGLSPRVRGNHEAAAGPPTAEGSIPACTGEPEGGHTMRAFIEVYPRVYGGTTMVLFGLSSAHGLSPRVRGNPAGPVPRGCQKGSIPACTGEPGTGSGRLDAVRVYPRVYGGTTFDDVDRLWLVGLSPRVRGNPLDFPNFQRASSKIIRVLGEESRRRPLSLSGVRRGSRFGAFRPPSDPAKPIRPTLCQVSPTKLPIPSKLVCGRWLIDPAPHRRQVQLPT